MSIREALLRAGINPDSPRKPFTGPATVPARRRGPAPTGSIERRINDMIYPIFQDLTKVCYRKIDARFPLRESNATQRLVHRRKIGVARDILNEHRNLVLEEILPFYEASVRKPGDTETDVDVLVQNLIVDNVFAQLVREYTAWMPEFSPLDEIKESTAVLTNVAEDRRARLLDGLRSFSFRARPVIPPSR